MDLQRLTKTLKLTLDLREDGYWCLSSLSSLDGTTLGGDTEAGISELHSSSELLQAAMYAVQHWQAQSWNVNDKAPTTGR